MSIDAEKWFEDWCARDRLRILAANPTIDVLIRDSQFYRLHYAVSKACRVAGGKGKTRAYQSQMDYLIDALYELLRLKRKPNQPNLEKWVQEDNPHQIFTRYRLKEAISKFKVLIASKEPDKET